MAICQMDSILFMHAATQVSAPTMLDAPSGSNLDLSCVQQLDASPFCKNYAKLYFDLKHLEKRWNRGTFLVPSFSKNPPFWALLEATQIF